MTDEKHDGTDRDSETQQPFTPPVSSDPLHPTQLQHSAPLGESSANEPSEPLTPSDQEMTTPLQTTPPFQNTTPLQSSPYSGQQPPQPPPGYAPPVHQPTAAAGGQMHAGYPPQGGHPGGPPPPPGGPGQPGQPNPSGKTNTLAIVSLISAFFISILGIILGHIALSQIKKTGEGGRGLALAGTIIGYVMTAIGIIITVVVIVSTLAVVGTATSAIDEANKQFEGLEESDDSFGDDPFSDDEQENYTYEEPWVGTEHEAYCNTFMNFDLLGENPEEYYEQVAQNSPNPKTAEVFRDYGEFISDPDKFDSADLDALIESLIEVEDEVFELCYEQ